jgi:dynein heavy chain, axonemal
MDALMAHSSTGSIDAFTRTLVSVLFLLNQASFCCLDLQASIDPMYQYSLPWFINLFVASVHAAPADENLQKRLQNVYDHFTYSLYRNVCRSLFEKDKLLFAFLLCSRILGSKGSIDADEWTFLLTGGLGPAPHSRPNPAAAWLVERSWREICKLSNLPAFAGIDTSFEQEPDAWRPLYDSPEPHTVKLPGGCGSSRTSNIYHQQLHEAKSSCSILHRT